MRAVSVIGYSESGKTYLVERVIQHLSTQGYNIASAKKIHVENFSIDTPGKDSWRHWQSGAQTVAIVAPEETTVIFHGVNLDLWKFSRFFSSDFLILEGFRKNAVPKILCVKTEEELNEELLKNNLVIGISGKAAGNLPKHPILPVLDVNNDFKKIINLVIEKAGPILPDLPDCRECSKTCQKLAHDILLKKNSIDSCVVLQREKAIRELKNI